MTCAARTVRTPHTHRIIATAAAWKGFGASDVRQLGAEETISTSDNEISEFESRIVRKGNPSITSLESIELKQSES